jgi:hypothetical protein
VKLKTINEQFDTRELHYKCLLRSKDSEIQSLTSKYEEQRRNADTETARGRALSAQVSTFSHTEAELRSQLNIYVEKFKQVRWFHAGTRGDQVPTANFDSRSRILSTTVTSFS